MEATLHNIPIIRGILSRTNLRAKKMGIVALMKSVVGIARSRIAIIMPKNTDKVLGEEPVLVISNHPAESDVPLLLSALKEREDTFLVASHQFLKILPEVDKNIIPVYINHRAWEINDLRLKIFCKFHSAKVFDREKSQQKNRESIALAARKIDQGGVVVIYPAAEELNNQFRNGVGFLLKNLKEKKKVKVVMAYIEGTSGWDYLRLIPFMGKLLPRIRINFSRAFRADQVIGNDGKITTKNLEKRYYDWVDSVGYG